MTTIAVNFTSKPPVFAPGEKITGEVFLKLDHPVKAKCVKVVLEGKASTEWEVTEKSTEYSHSRSSLVPYSAEIELAKGEDVVWKADDRHKKQLPEGIQTYPFTFTLPEPCPPSFEGKVGWIRYSLTVIIERPWKTNKIHTEYFSVCPPVDLNIIPTAPDPQTFSKTKSIGLVFFRYGKVSLQCCLPKTGFVSGELLHVDVDINNESSRQIISMEISLIEVADYVAYRYGAQSTRWHGTLDGENTLHQNNRKTDERKVIKMDKELHIEPRTSQSISMDIPIPPCVPSFDTCSVIHTKHNVEVKIVAKGTINTTARCICHVIIGTIPLANSFSGRLSATASHTETEPKHADIEPVYEPCEYAPGNIASDTFTPLVGFHRHMLAEKETCATPRIS